MPELLRAVAEQGYTEPTPIQSQAIPIVLAGRDLLGAAQTGTGKTAGFTLPLLQRLAPIATKSFSPALHPVRCLILTPTRELAIQVHESVKTYGKHVPLRSFVVYGGVNINPQIEELKRGVEILVATPGRLLDLVGQKAVNLGKVQILVLDEGDRMLDMGFIPDIKRIIALLPAARQTLLFSATFSDEIRKLAAQFQKDPAKVEVARRNEPIALVTQYVYHIDANRKRELLSHLVKKNNWAAGAGVHARPSTAPTASPTQLQKDGINADAIHGNKSQNARIRALEDFKEGKVKVLVATDIAARGLDIEDLPHVVNFDLPHVPEDYVHRIGRTGRAGATGEALSLVGSEDRPLLAAIERLINKKIEVRHAEGFEAEGPPRPRSPAGRDRANAGRGGRAAPRSPHRRRSAPSPLDRAVAASLAATGAASRAAKAAPAARRGGSVPAQTRREAARGPRPALRQLAGAAHLGQLRRHGFQQALRALAFGATSAPADRRTPGRKRQPQAVPALFRKKAA